MNVLVRQGSLETSDDVGRILDVRSELQLVQPRLRMLQRVHLLISSFLLAPHTLTYSLRF